MRNEHSLDDIHTSALRVLDVGWPDMPLGDEVKRRALALRAAAHLMKMIHAGAGGFDLAIQIEELAGNLGLDPSEIAFNSFGQRA